MAKQNRTREQDLATLDRLDRFARLTDTAVPVPFTGLRVGIDPIIGLIPVVGDIAGFVLSGYVLIEAHRAGAHSRIKFRMLRNMGVELVVGMVPIIGDAFDVVYRANEKNARLLREHIEERLSSEKTGGFEWKKFLVAAVLIGAITALVTYTLAG